MSGTYGDMQTRIADEVQDSSITSQIKNAIQDAIKLYERDRFYFNVKSGVTFSTVANQEYYTSADLADIPTLIGIDSMTVTNNGVVDPVQARDFRDIDASQWGAAISLPRAFAYYGEKIRFYPIPDAAYTITMAYQYRLAALSADADTNAWMTDGEMLIRQCAKGFLAADVMQEGGVAQAAATLEVRALEALRKETRRRMSNELLRSDMPLTARRGAFNINYGY